MLNLPLLPACRFQAQMQSEQSSASLDHPSQLRADNSSASLHAHSSSDHSTPTPAPYASASPKDKSMPSNYVPPVHQESSFTGQDQSSACASDMHVQASAPSGLDRQEPAQQGAASPVRPSSSQPTAHTADSPNMVHLKAMAAQAERLIQVVLKLVFKYAYRHVHFARIYTATPCHNNLLPLTTPRRLV